LKIEGPAEHVDELLEGFRTSLPGLPPIVVSHMDLAIEDFGSEYNQPGAFCIECFT
jgi:hypothetical protein